MPQQNPQLDALIQRVDSAISEHHTLINGLATQLADLAQTFPTSRLTDLEKAVNELANLTNESLAGHTEAINELAAANIAQTKSKVSLFKVLEELDGPKRQYVLDKLGEHETQLNQLYGDTPSKITDRIAGIESSIVELRRVLAEHEDRLDEAHDQITDVSGCAIDSIKGRLDQHRGHIARIDAVNETLHQRLTELEA